MENKIPDGSKFMLTLKGGISDGESVRLADLIDQLKAVKDVLNALDKKMIGAKKPSLFYRVVGMNMNSPAIIEIEAVPQEGKIDVGSRVIRNLISGLKYINDGKRPIDADFEVMESFREIAAPLKRNLATLSISSNNESVEVSQNIEQRVEEILGPDQVEIGSVRGSLDLIDLHNKKNLFKIYPIIGAKSIKCHFPDQLLQKAVSGLNHFVKVYGEIHTKSNEQFPHFIQIYDIEVLPESSDIPLLSSLRGFAKGAYLGKSSSDHIIDNRDDW